MGLEITQLSRTFLVDLIEIRDLNELPRVHWDLWSMGSAHPAARPP